MWLANFLDGSSVSSKSTNWTELPKDKKLTGVQLSHPLFPKLYLCLGDLDKYYFAKESLAFFGSEQGTVVAEIAGGHDLRLGIGIEMRLEYTGSVVTKVYPLSEFKYSPDILHEGKGTKKREA